MTARMMYVLQLATELGLLGFACAVALANRRRLLGTALGLIMLQPILVLVFSVLIWSGQFPLRMFQIVSDLACWCRIAGCAALLSGIAALGKDQKQNNK